MIALPDRATLIEVGPRDGLQSLGRWVPTADKVWLIERLAAAGFREIEAVGFVSPRFIPALADAEEVLERLPPLPGVRLRGLVPNARGAQRAAATRLDEVVALITASVAYTARNQNTTIERAVENAIESVRIAEAAGKAFSVAIGMALWCPLDGEIPEERVAAIVARLHGAGVRQMMLAGSMGMEDPVTLRARFARLLDRHPGLDLCYHVHDMAGLASANVLAAMDAGVRRFETSICGLGGGVATPEAIGNMPSEDIAQMMELCGVRTGIAARDAILAAREIAARLGLALPSRAGQFGDRAEILAHAHRKSSDRLRRTEEAS
ncbi:MAG: hydroxymethylglutaryl-CoA lyase [Acetobacteraceae bacterium]|nr:hydroxymethylglutaryl-CoA lyase [Acetobacteraceae bacterium]